MIAGPSCPGCGLTPYYGGLCGACRDIAAQPSEPLIDGHTAACWRARAKAERVGSPLPPDGCVQ